MSEFDNLSPEDAEYVVNLPSHLAEASMADDLCEILIDFDFARHKVSDIGISPLVGDYDFTKNLKNENEFKLIQRALEMSSDVIENDKTQLAGQLLGRLLKFNKFTTIKILLNQAQNYEASPWIRPLLSNLKSARNALLFQLEKHESIVTKIAITPDSKKAVSASQDKTIKVWDLTTAEEVFTLTGHTDWVWGVAITPDGKRIVSASQDNTLKVWDLITNEEVLTFTGHTHSVTGVAITPNGKWVVSVSGDHNIKVWDIVNGKELMKFTGEGAFSCCDISPDETTLIAGELSGRLHFLRLEGLGKFRE